MPREVNEFFLQVLGVLATPALVLTNRQLLKNVDCASLLMLTHNSIVCIFFIRQICGIDVNRSNKLPFFWAPTVSIISVSSLWASNAILQRTSVSFHQLCKVLTIPCGAIVDNRVFGIHRTKVELCFHIFVVVGAIIIIEDEGENRGHLDIDVLPVAFLFIVATISGIASNKYARTHYDIHASQLVGLIVPYSLFASIVLYIATESSIHDFIEALVKLSFQHPFILPLNLGFACSVQYLSTWSSTVSSNALYAVLGQVKVLLAIILGKMIEGEYISLRLVIGTCIIVISATGATSAEVLKIGQTKLKLILFTMLTGSIVIKWLYIK